MRVDVSFVFETARVVFLLLMLISIIIGVANYELLNSDQKRLIYIISFALIVELTSVTLWFMGINNHYIFHFYAPIEFVLFTSIYKRHLEGVIKPIYFQGLTGSFVLFAVINTLFFQGLREFNSHVTFVECLLLIALAFTYFYVMLRDLKYRKLERNPMFWINVSVLTYFSGALVLFHLANELIPESMAIRGLVWGVHAIFNIVHYLLFGIALWVRPEAEKYS